MRFSQFRDVVKVAHNATHVGVFEMVGNGGLKVPPSAPEVLTSQHGPKNSRGIGQQRRKFVRDAGPIVGVKEQISIDSCLYESAERPRIRSKAGLTYCRMPAWSVTTMMSAELDTSALKRRSD